MKLFLLTSILATRVFSNEFDLSISLNQVTMKKVHHENCLFATYKDLPQNFEVFGYDLEDEIKGARLGVIGFSSPSVGQKQSKWNSTKDFFNRVTGPKKSDSVSDSDGDLFRSIHSVSSATRVKFCRTPYISLNNDGPDDQLSKMFFFRKLTHDDYIVKSKKNKVDDSSETQNQNNIAVRTTKIVYWTAKLLILFSWHHLTLSVKIFS